MAGDSKSIPKFDEFVPKSGTSAIPSFDEFSAKYDASHAGGWRGVSTSKSSAGSDSPVMNAMSHAGARISEIPGAIGNAAMHPIDTISGMYGQQKQLAGEGVDAFKSGDYPLAAARAVETAIPGVGPAIANGFKTIKSGDTSGGIGDMIGSVGPALALRGMAASPKIRAFAGGAKDAMTENVPSFRIGHVSVQAPVPAPLAGAFTGATLGRLVGHPIPGAIAGAVAPIVRGGMRAAAGEPWLPQSAEAIPNPIIPSSQRLLNRGGIVSPPPDVADASYVRGVPAMAHPPNPARAIGAPVTARAMPGSVEDSSYVRGVPAMTQPSNPARALPPGPGRVIQMPSPPDSSFVRGVPAEYGFRVPQESQVLSGPLTPPETALSSNPVASTQVSESPNTSVTQQYRPSRTNARFDADGKRLWPGRK